MNILYKKSSHYMQRFGQRLLGFTPRIAAGPGKGLRFDVGRAAAEMVSGKYELPVQNAVKSLLHADDVFYDIGANVGFFSVLASRLVTASGLVYAFEPIEANASVVERNSHLNGMRNIEVLRVAVSRKAGKGELLLAGYAGGAVLKNAGIPPDLEGSLWVDTVSIDDLVRLQRIQPPNVVKIDVEGAELDVLHGMLVTLQEYGPDIVLEVDDSSEIECMEKLKACREYLQGLGYRSEVLQNSYKDGRWFVRHLVGIKKG